MRTRLASVRFAAAMLLGGCSPSPDGGPPPGDGLFVDASSDTGPLLEAALAVLDRRLDPGRFGAPREFPLRGIAVDDLGLGHVHLTQTVDGVPVLGGEIIVHLRADGGVRAITDTLVPDLAVDTTPDVDAREALALATAPDGPPEPGPADDDAAEVLGPPPDPELWILRHDGVDHLVWSVQLVDLAGAVPTMPRVFVDAHSGAEVWRYENLQSAETQTETRYDGRRTIQAFPEPPWWYLEDPARRFVTTDFRNTSSTLYYVRTTAAVFPDRSTGSVHVGTQATWDYFWAEHGRSGIDGLGGPGFVSSRSTGARWITGSAHFRSNYNNAFWDGTNHLFVSGDGDGVTFGPLVSVDVIAHEFTHGVTQYTANLIYANESGALNESMSDVFGAAVEARMDGAVSPSTWEIGEDCFTPGVSGDALRYLDDPTADGSSRDHYDARYVGALDNGGVHWNSGIANLAFHLVSEGGDHPRLGGTPVTGIGLGAAADVWYRALTVYATSSTDFRGMRVATILAAEDLFGVDSAEAVTVDDAWALVGVTPWVLLPGGWASGGVGAPSVVVQPSTGRLIMAFESQTGPSTDECPHGVWKIGLATSTDGVTFTRLDPALLEPDAGYASCVVAHPTLLLDDSGTGLELWFKAERGTTACGDDDDCLYSGIGYAHVTADLLGTDVRSAAPVVATNRPMGFPSVVRVNGVYTMALQHHPDEWLATASAPAGPWTVSASPVRSIGVTAFADDELFNPALTCSGGGAAPSVVTDWFGGRDRDGSWGAVLDGGVGRATSTDGGSWTVDPQPAYGFDGEEKWRHWSALRHGAGTLLYYSQTVGGRQRIGLRTRLTAWSPAGVASRSCP